MHRIRPLHCFLTLFFLCNAVQVSARTWTDLDQRSLEAELIEQTADSIRVRRLTDQVIFTIPKDRLSATDLEYLKSLNAESVVDDTEAPTFLKHGLVWENRISVPDDFELEIISEDTDTDAYHYRSNHFDFHSNVKLARNTITEFAEIFEATFALIKASPLNWNVTTLENRFQAKLYETEEQYLAAGAIPGSAGIYKSRTKTIYVRLDSLGTKKNSTSISLDGGNHGTLIHEITHQVLEEWLGRMPIWLSEGYAEYIESLEYDRGTFRLSRKEAISRGNAQEVIDSPIALMEISGREWNATFTNRPFDVSRQYRTAYLITYYFIHLDGDKDGYRIWHYLRALERAKSQEDIQAAQAILLDGRDGDQLFDDMRRAYRRENINLELFEY